MALRKKKEIRTAEDLEKARAVAEELFMYTAKSQDEIADLVKVTRGTISNWKKQHDWEGKRERLRNTASKALTIYCNVLDKLEQLTSKTGEDWNFDDIAKAAATLERFDNKRNAPVQVEKVGMLFAEFITLEMPEQRDQLLDIYRRFTQWLVEHLATK